jgi:dTDP-4-dehydrorhamnose reductase
MKRPILLFGKGGQVGSELVGLLPRLGEIVALGRAELDLAKPDEIREVIRRVHPELIVNATAYTAVDQAEKEPSLAQAINSDAPEIMAEEGKKIGASLVHYSTDYVFDGTKNVPYLEDDPPHPLSVYGRTKLAGEQAIRSSGVSHLIFRTAWVYAAQGRNFLLTVLRLATQRDELRIVRDQYGAPTRNVEIAASTIAALKKIAERSHGGDGFANLGGTYHMTAAGVTTWYDFAVAILEEASATPTSSSWLTSALAALPLRAKRVTPITTEEYPTPARRPAYSVLSNSKLAKAFGIELPDWGIQLHRAFADQSHSSRSHETGGRM